MWGFKWVVFVGFYILGLSFSLVTLPAVEDNDILKTEAAIRNTTNTIFNIFQAKNLQARSKIKQYSTIHKYFISLTIQDYDSLKEVAKLTRVDKKNIENVTTDFIVLLNEIIDEDNAVSIESILRGDVTGLYDLQDEIHKLEYLKSTVVDANKPMDINAEILKILEQEEFTPFNYNVSNELQHTLENPLPKLENDTLSDKDSVWNPGDILPISGRRIYKGYRTKVNHFPFMASVQIFNKFQCGGSIISSDIVITAASCLQLAWNNRLYRENPAFLSVRVGTSFYESGGEAIPVLEVYFHPSYNPRNLHHNLAMMRLIRRIRFFKKKVKKITIDTHESALPMNVDGVATLGWGARTPSNVLHGPFENRLAVAVLDVYPLQDCQEIYSSEYVTERNFCAGFISVGAGACNRDVGGPGVVAGYLAGVISFGAPVCGTPDAPTVFTKVGYYHEWIENIMEQEVPYAGKRTTLLTTRFTYPAPTKYNPINHTHWSVTPITSKEETTTPATEETKVYTNLREKPKKKKTIDKKLFKEFLKTMFESDEIEEYLDMMRQESGGPKSTTPTDYQDVLLADLKEATRMMNVDPEPTPSSEIERDENGVYELFDGMTSMTEKLPSTVDLDETTDGLAIEEFPQDTRYQLDEEIENEDDSNDPDKELEERILQLVNEESSTPVPLKHDKQNKYESKEESKVMTKNEKEKQKKIDEAILTLLYLSDGEKTRDNVSISNLITENNEEFNEQQVDQEATKQEPVETKKEKSNVRELPTSTGEESRSSSYSENYESETEELVIPMTTATLESYITSPLTKTQDPTISKTTKLKTTKHTTKHVLKKLRPIPRIISNKKSLKTMLKTTSKYKHKKLKTIIHYRNRQNPQNYLKQRLEPKSLVRQSKTIVPQIKHQSSQGKNKNNDYTFVMEESNPLIKTNTLRDGKLASETSVKKDLLRTLLKLYSGLLKNYKKNAKSGKYYADMDIKNNANKLIGYVRSSQVGKEEKDNIKEASEGNDAENEKISEIVSGFNNMTNEDIKSIYLRDTIDDHEMPETSVTRYFVDYILA